MNITPNAIVSQGELPPSTCPACSSTLDAFTGVAEDEVRASPGDLSVSVCVYCSCLLAFNDELKLELPNDEQIVAIAGDPELLTAIRVARRVRERRA